jgi:basic amino acid/polyamine antiporter, APA family
MPLLRSITRWDMLALMVNATIGGGIYALPAEVFAKSGVWSLAAMAICALVISFIVACFAEVGSRFTNTGGTLVYAQEAFGSFAGFMTGWLSLVLRIVSMAAICNIAVAYAGFFFPGLLQHGWASTSMILFITLGLTTVNYLGIRQSVWLNNVFTVTKLVTLLFFVGVGIFFLKKENFSATGLPTGHDFMASILLMVFAFSGFDGAVTTTGEMKDPQRDIPHTLFRVLFFKTALYLLIQLVCIGTLVSLGSSKKPLAEAAELMLPGWGGWLITLGALISFVATLNGGMLVASRICFGLAESHRLPGIFAKTHPVFHSPSVAILFTAILMLILALTNSLLFLLTISALGRLLIYIVSCAALIRLRNKESVPRALFMLPAGKMIAALSIAACIVMMTGSTSREWIMLAGVLMVGIILKFVVNALPEKGEKQQGVS